MRSSTNCQPQRMPSGGRARALTTALILALACSLAGFARQAGAQADVGFSPSGGHAQVIAQGVAELPQGDAIWRTVRTRAALPADAAFAPRPLGFVLASTGPLLVVDKTTGEATQLGTGEAMLTRDGAVQQRSSLGAQPVSYLSIELVPANAPAPPEGEVVLQPGQPFAVPAGWHDLDLLSDTLAGGDSFTIPDSGAKNVLLVTAGAAAVGRPGGQAVVLLAGEAASFSGELQVAVAPPDSGTPGPAQTASFVVAMIGPQMPAPPAAAQATQPTATASGTAAAEAGSITAQVFVCPPGMTAETLEAAACAPAAGEFDVTISGAALQTPLTLNDAATAADAFTWSDLPFGSYTIA
ncbi:MAG TPA: hypothetical protein VFI22_17500, partial [Thermomicrobiales bacterium]|nr:hypothetical protein [Thermomicrobiales bacterium]